MTISLASLRDLALLTLRLGRPTIAAPPSVCGTTASDSDTLAGGLSRQPGPYPRPGWAATWGT